MLILFSLQFVELFFYELNIAKKNCVQTNSMCKIVICYLFSLFSGALSKILTIIISLRYLTKINCPERSKSKKYDLIYHSATSNTLTRQITKLKHLKVYKKLIEV